MQTLYLAIAATLLISGCAQVPADAQSTPGSAKPLQLACDNGFTIAARYDNSDPALAKAMLTINGRDYALFERPAASGARYTTENGMTPGMLLEWRTKGNEAMLWESPLDDRVKPEDAELRATCTKR